MVPGTRVLRFMPLFEVTVKGRDIRLVVADGEVVGFFYG